MPKLLREFDFFLVLIVNELSSLCLYLSICKKFCTKFQGRNMQLFCNMQLLFIKCSLQSGEKGGEKREKERKKENENKT